MNNLEPKCQFAKKILKSGFVANVQWQEERDLCMLHHIFNSFCI